MDGCLQPYRAGYSIPVNAQGVEVAVVDDLTA